MKTFLSKIYHSKIFWAVVVFPVLLAGIYLGPAQMLLNRGGSNQLSHVLVVTQSNAQDVQTQLSATKLPVFFELCSGDMCKLQDADLEKVAAKYDGKVLFVEIDPALSPTLAKGAAQLLDGEQAIPTHLLVTPSGEYALSGVRTADELSAFIDGALNSKVIKVTADNAQQVQAKLQSANLPVLYVLCTPDLCKAQDSELNKLADAYDGKLLVVEINPLTSPTLATKVAQAVGGLVYPAYMLVTPSGAAVPAAGLMDEASLAKFVDAALAAKPASDPSGTGAPSATPTPAPSK
jgi:thioredoxin-like negative regulator of GroEL